MFVYSILLREVILCLLGCFQENTTVYENMRDLEVSLIVGVAAVDLCINQWKLDNSFIICF